MKFLVIVCVAALIYFEVKRERSLSIEYFYDGPHQTEIAEGLSYWTTNRLNFKQVYSIEDAYVVIDHIDDYKFKDSDWVARYSPRTRSIFLNKRYDNILKDNYLRGAVAHEAGHMFGLPHAEEKDSIMHYKIFPDAKPTMLDKLKVNDKLDFLYYKMLIEDFISKNVDNQESH